MSSERFQQPVQLSASHNKLRCHLQIFQPDFPLLPSPSTDVRSTFQSEGFPCRLLFFIFHRNFPEYISFTSNSIVVSTPGGSNPHSFKEGWFSKEEACHWLLDMIPCSSIITSFLYLGSKTENGLNQVNTIPCTAIWG